MPAQRHRRGRVRRRELLLVEAGGLPPEGVAVEVEISPERRQLVGEQRRVDAGVGGRGGRHGRDASEVG